MMRGNCKFGIVLVVVISLLLTGCSLAEPVIEPEDLSAYFNFDVDAVEMITVNKGDSYPLTGFIAADSICGLLNKVELGKVISEDRSEERDQTNAISIELSDNELRFNFNGDYTQLWINDGVKPTYSYEVLNPEILQDEAFPLYPEFFWYQEAILTGAQRCFDLSDETVDELQMIGALVYSDDRDLKEEGHLAVFTAKSSEETDVAYLMEFSYEDDEFTVVHCAVGQPAGSTGYYPNYAEFDDQTYIWTTVSNTCMQVSNDGITANPNQTMNNPYFLYRIYYSDGSTSVRQAYNQIGIFVIPEGKIPVKIHPLQRDVSQEIEVTALTMNFE